MAFTDPSDFDKVIKVGDEYLSRVEEELENEGKKQVLSRVEKGFAKTVKWETINFPLNQLMKYHLRLPFPHAPKVLSRNPKMWVSKTPILEHPAVLIAIPEWENKYSTKSYAVDVKEGYIYVSLHLRVQNAVSPQPCVGKFQISLVLFNFLHCNFRLWFKTP